MNWKEQAIRAMTVLGITVGGTVWEEKPEGSLGRFSWDQGPGIERSQELLRDGGPKLSFRGGRPGYLEAPSVIVDLQEARAQQKWEEVKAIMETHPEKFSPQDFEDLKIYFPIYWEVATKYGQNKAFDWYTLWIFHKEETTVSQDEGTLAGENGYIGAMQRDPDFYPESYVDEAVKGLPECLKEISTRDPTDLREIAFAGRKLSEDYERLKDRRGAFRAYCAQFYADRRYFKDLALREIFG